MQAGTVMRVNESVTCKLFIKASEANSSLKLSRPANSAILPRGSVK
ncbi:Uncharacterised protein [Mycobacterium tuberculosis]|nr:Uncharacterised protein [Mycobacterium tuberculosis]